MRRIVQPDSHMAVFSRPFSRKTAAVPFVPETVYPSGRVDRRDESEISGVPFDTIGPRLSSPMVPERPQDRVKDFIEILAHILGQEPQREVAAFPKQQILPHPVQS